MLVQLFQALSPLVVVGPLPSGPPTYDLEIWLANATLGITFPLLVLHADFFGFWPFGAESRPQRPRPESPATTPRPAV